MKKNTKKMSMTKFRKEMFKEIPKLKKGDKLELTHNNIIVAEVRGK